MPKQSHLLFALTALVGATLTQATVTGYSNTLSSYVAAATGVTSTYTFTPQSGINKAFRSFEITNQGFSAASSPLTASCKNLISLPTAAMSTTAGASQTAEFAFKTSTDLAVDGKITLKFPENLLTAVETTKSCEMVPNPTSLSTTDSTTTKGSIIIQVKEAVKAGSIKVTCSGLTFAPLAENIAKVAIDGSGKISGGVEITTSLDKQKAYISTPAVGSVTASLNALTLSKSVGTGGILAVSFRIASAFTADATKNKIILTFPNGYITQQASNMCGISTPVATTTSVYLNDKITLTVTSALAATSITVTCSGLTLAAKSETKATHGGSTGLKIETSSDLQGAFVTVPAVGEIQNPKLQISKSVSSSGTATISFQTSTELQQSSANQIVLSFPSGSVTAQADNLCGITSSVTVATSKFSSGIITMTLATFSSLPQGSVIITCSGLTLVSKPEIQATTGGTSGLKIETSTDKIAAFVTIPAVGAVTLPALTMTTAVGEKQSATFTFTIATPMDKDTNKDIIITLPDALLVDAATADKCLVSGLKADEVTSALAGDKTKITVTVKAAVAAGSVTVTCTELTLVSRAASEENKLLAITTTKDQQAGKVATPAVGVVTVDLVTSSPSFSASFASKELVVTSAVDVWTASSGTSVTCTVSSFTNAALSSSQSSRSLLQSNQVEISVKNSNGVLIGVKSSTGQSFPASVPAIPTRTLYLPKASSSSHAFAWMCFVLSAIFILL